MPLSFRRERYIWLQIQAASHLVNFLYPCRAIIVAPKWNDPFVEIVTFLFHWRFTMAYSSCFCPVLAAYHILSLSCLLHKNSKDSSTCCLVFLGSHWCFAFGVFFFNFVGLFLTGVIQSSGMLVRCHLSWFLHKNIQGLRSHLCESKDYKTLF